MRHHRIVTAALTVLVFCALPAAAQVAGADKIATNAGPAELLPIHHASMMLTFKGAHVLIDPAPVTNGAQGDALTQPYKALPPPELILITHIHGDHFSAPILSAVAAPNTIIVAPQNVRDAMPADLQAKTKVMKNGEKATYAGVPLEAVAMYNTTAAKANFHPKGAGNGYILTLGDKRVYIAGDTEETPELEHLANIEVAFIPINLPYTQTVDAAAKWVKDFHPKFVFPYHFSNQDGTTSDMAAFENQVGNASIVRLRKWY